VLPSQTASLVKFPQRYQKSHRIFCNLNQGTREIRVILYAKDYPFCATVLAEELPIEDILAVEDDIVPFDWAVCSSRERSIPLASGSHSLAGTCRAARNLPRSGWRPT